MRARISSGRRLLHWKICIVDDQALSQNTGWNVVWNNLSALDYLAGGIAALPSDLIQFNQLPFNKYQQQFGTLRVKILTARMNDENHHLNQVIQKIRDEEFDILIIDLDLTSFPPDKYKQEELKGGGFIVWREAMESGYEQKLCIIYTGQDDLVPIIKSIDGYRKSKPLILSVGNTEVLEERIDEFLELQQRKIVKQLTLDEINGIKQALQNGNYHHLVYVSENDEWTIETLFPKQVLRNDKNQILEILEGRFLDLFHEMVVFSTIDSQTMPNLFQKLNRAFPDDEQGKAIHFHCWDDDLANQFIGIVNQKYQKLKDIHPECLGQVLDNLNNGSKINAVKSFLTTISESRDWLRQLEALKGSILTNDLPRLSPEAFFHKYPLFWKDLKAVLEVADASARRHGESESGVIEIKVFQGYVSLLKKYCVILELKTSENVMNDSDIKSAKAALKEEYSSDVHWNGRKIRLIRELVCFRYYGQFQIISGEHLIRSCQKRVEKEPAFEDSFEGTKYRIEIPEFLFQE